MAVAACAGVLTRDISAARGWRRLAMAALLIGHWVLASTVAAQALESALAPGKMSEAHAKYEDDCEKCHVRFDRNGQDKLCTDCHKDVGQDTRAQTGYHGRMKPQACRTCHTEHKGPGAKIAAFDKTKFDHAQTNYALRGGHQKVDCAKCHLPTKGYRVAMQDCVACHQKDDKHKGSLGPKCVDCHTETNWKEARFDHSKSRFALTGKHETVKCAECHKDTNYKETPHACLACHKKDDKHKTRYGEKCETCHGTKDWKGINFNHDVDTHYALLGKHRTVKCDTCHVGNLYHDKLTNVCVDCHKKDDKHKASLGNECARCHVERDWKERAKFDHAKTDFPLLGKHATVQCKDCHKDVMYKEAPKACIACHKKDDKHKGSLGEACGKCHYERDWKKTSFDHAKSDFPLLGKHQKAECNTCHKSINFKEAPKDCYSCHRKDDKHEDQEGRLCEKCHDEKAWKPAPKFDHGLARFPLLGKHEPLECKKCHVNPRFKDAKIDCYACHVKDDKHKKALSTDCGLCHNARSWKAWVYDHDKQTKFVLDGKHKGLACGACHKLPMEAKVVTSTQCVSCHAKNDVHDGSYGRQCQQCHVSSSFKTIKSRTVTPVGSVAPAPMPPSLGSVRVGRGASGGWLS